MVYRSDSLAEKGETLQRAQQLVVALQRGFVLILIVTAVAIAGTVLVARNRLRAALVLLLGAAATFVVVRALVNKVLDEIPSVARTPAGQAALAAATTALADSLVKALGVLAVLFLFGAIVVYVLDADSALRRRLATRTGSPSLRDAIAAYRVPVALMSAGAALLVITIGGFSRALVDRRAAAGRVGDVRVVGAGSARRRRPTAGAACGAVSRRHRQLI